MYHFYFDESFHDQANVFTVCGMTAFKSEHMWQAHRAMEEVRSKYGLNKTDKLKFQSSSKPAQLTSEQHASIKNDVIAIAKDVKCVFFSSCKFNNGKPRQRSSQNVIFGLNTLVHKANSFLKQQADFGTLLIDRSESADMYADLRDKFQRGTFFKNVDKWGPVPRILSYGMTADGLSNFSSINDILVGAWRFVVNDTKNATVRKTLQDSVSQVMWNKDGVFREYGFCLRPLNRKNYPSNVVVDYDNLRRELTSRFVLEQ